MTSKTFVSGTIIDSAWLNDVNDATYAIDTAPAGSFRAAVESSAGASLMGYLPTGTGAVATDVQSKLSESVSVKDFGAVGDGVTDDTAAFLAASAVSKSIYVPHTATAFLINNLNLPFDTRVWGPGAIKTSGGAVVQLSTTNFEVDDSAMRVMFIESDKQGWEEMLDIKSCGYNTIMAYVWYSTLGNVIANAEAVGLKVIVHSAFTAANQASWGTLATAAMAYDSRPSVIGYYVFDEPVGNSISVANQNIGLAYFTAETQKPLSCAEQSVVYSTTGSLATTYDLIFTDSYYANASTTANDAIAANIRLISAYQPASPRAKLIPLVGLFNDTGFTQTKAKTVSLAEILCSFASSKEFGVFCWNAGTTGTYEGVRNTPEYRAAAKNLKNLVESRKPWRVEVIPIGTAFLSSNELSALLEYNIDGASPAVAKTSNIVPWDVVNAGANIDYRQRTYADSGLMLQTTHGRVGFRGMPSGICCGFLSWINRTNGSALTIEVGSTSDATYTMSSAITVPLSSGNSTAFYKQLDVGGSFTNMPVLDLTAADAPNFPDAFLRGYLTFTDVPEVTF